MKTVSLQRVTKDRAIRCIAQAGLILLLFLLMLLPGSADARALAQSPGVVGAGRNLYITGQVGGYAEAQVYANGTLYASMGSRVCAADAQANPGTLGAPHCSLPTQREIYQMAVSADGRSLYALSPDQGMLIFDISNRLAPVQVGQYSGIYLALQMAAGANGLVYLATSNPDHIQIVDASDPANPVLRDYVDRDEWAALSKMVIRNGYLYRPDGIAGIEVFAIGADGGLSRVGVIARNPAPANRDIGEIAIAGRYLYTADVNGMEIWDLDASPTAPSLLYAGMANQTIPPLRIAAAGSYAFSLTESTLSVVRLAGGLTTRQFYTFPLRSCRHLSVPEEGGILYLSCDSGVQMFSLANPEQPALLLSQGMPSRLPYPEGFAVDSGHLYAANGYGLSVYDAAPGQPLAFERFVPGYADSEMHDVDLSFGSRYAYVADRYNGLVIYDLTTTPGSPTRVKQVSIPYAYTVKADFHIHAFFPLVVHNIAYVGTRGDGIYKVDLSDMDNPVIAAHITDAAAVELPAADPTQMDVSGGKLFVGCYLDGLRVYDVSGDSGYALLGSWDSMDAGEPVYGVAAVGDTVYVLTGKRLFALDVSNPSLIHPIAGTEIGAVDNPLGAADGLLRMSAGYLFSASSSSGLLAIDVQNSLAPRVVGESRYFSTLTRVYPRGRAGSFDLFTANGSYGLTQWRFQTPVYLPMMRR